MEARKDAGSEQEGLRQEDRAQDIKHLEGVAIALSQGSLRASCFWNTLLKGKSTSSCRFLAKSLRILKHKET